MTGRYKEVKPEYLVSAIKRGWPRITLIESVLRTANERLVVLGSEKSREGTRGICATLTQDEYIDLKFKIQTQKSRREGA